MDVSRCRSGKHEITTPADRRSNGACAACSRDNERRYRERKNAELGHSVYVRQWEHRTFGPRQWPSQTHLPSTAHTAPVSGQQHRQWALHPRSTEP
ncbi:Uncharacterised protein [Mycobacteroides abscessus subsp. abscessus]|nr:Uncharacterised protein [Mycobacteroides abscessus subsp. abscessus]